MTVSPASAKKSSGKAVMLSLLAISAFPVLVAVALYQSSWQPTQFTNYGELLQPARQISDVKVHSLDGKPFSLSDLRRKWTLVYVGSGNGCSRDCWDSLYKMRQLRLALARDMSRMQTVLVLTGTVDRHGMANRFRDYPDLRVLSASGAARLAVQQQFQSAAFEAPVQAPLHLMDPLGNLMMRYPADADPKKMLKDLKYLMKNSRIG